MGDFVIISINFSLISYQADGFHFNHFFYYFSKESFDDVFKQRIQEADEFYNKVLLFHCNVTMFQERHLFV